MERKIQQGSQWRSRTNDRVYTVTAPVTDTGMVKFRSNHTASATGLPFKYQYDLARFSRIFDWVSGPVETEPEPSPGKWAEVERTLRLYNAANREAKRLADVLTKTFEATARAREAVDAHREAIIETSAAYREALRKMEESVQ